MKRSLLFIFSMCCLHLVALCQLSGNYTINNTLPTGGNNFSSFADVAIALNTQGISGSVKIDVVVGTGPYSGQVTFNTIAGSSAFDTVVIDGNGNSLDFAGTITSHAGIELNGTDYLTIRNLTINGSGTRAWCVLFRNGSDYNRIENCVLNMPILTGAPSSAGVYSGIVFASSVTSSTSVTSNCGANNIIVGNSITGGDKAFSLYGTAAFPSAGNIISTNILKDYYTYAIHVQNVSDLKILKNDVSRPLLTSMPTAGNYTFYLNGAPNCVVDGNRIHNLFDSRAVTTSGSATTMNCIGLGSLGGRNVVISNNIIYNLTNYYQSITGITVQAGTAKVYHNSLSFDNQDLGNGGVGAGAGITTGISVSDSTYIFNNIVSITRYATTGAKRAVFKSTSAKVSSDFNNFYLAGNGSAQYYVGTSTTLANWQSGSDVNSLTIDPQFNSYTSGDLYPNDLSLYGAGTPVGISDDISGMLRSVTAPTIGAFETATPLPVTLLSFKAYLQNTGNVSLHWETANETNNRHFEIERSTDAISFEKIASVPASKSLKKRYSYADKTINGPDGSQFFYRLKQVDNSGNFKYSFVERIILSSSHPDIQISPNPVNSYLNISSVTNKITEAVIVDITGRVLKRTVDKNGISRIDNLDDLACGFYTILLVDSNSILSKYKFAKK